MCTRCTVNRKAVDLPHTWERWFFPHPNRKGDFCLGGSIEDRECWSGAAYLPRTVIGYLPCETKVSKSSHALPKGKASITSSFSIWDFHMRNKSLLKKLAFHHASVWYFSDLLCSSNFYGTHFLLNKNKIPAKWQMILLPSIYFLEWKYVGNFPFPECTIDMLLEELDLDLKYEYNFQIIKSRSLLSWRRDPSQLNQCTVGYGAWLPFPLVSEHQSSKVCHYCEFLHK